jgi:NAD(P)-dependent dehydrogenase (short-subunit alcohol dehydrogenase family)
MKVQVSSIPDMASNAAGPCIIHIGSFRSLQSDPNQEGYAAAKAGLRGLLHSQAISAEPWGIRVNLVAPGLIRATHECKEGDEKGWTWENSVEDGDHMGLPANRPGMPEDISRAVEYLIGAGFVTGQDIVVDGGATKVKKVA